MILASKQMALEYGYKRSFILVGGPDNGQEFSDNSSISQYLPVLNSVIRYVTNNGKRENGALKLYGPDSKFNFPTDYFKSAKGPRVPHFIEI